MASGYVSGPQGPSTHFCNFLALSDRLSAFVLYALSVSRHV